MTVEGSDSSHDGKLVALLCSDDPKDREKAWERVYLDNYPKIKSLVKSMKGRPEDFSDIYHDSLLALRRNIEQEKFGYKASISTYLYRICFNQCCKKFNQNGKALQAEQAFGEIIGIDGEYDLEQDALWSRVSNILATELKEECREILVKFYLEGLSIKQLREYFNVNSEQAAKNKKMRCLNYLRKAVENVDINPEALKR